MATRMQQRRGTALQWTTADPILNAGEMGWESDTNKFKIGDGINHWDDLDYFLDAVALGGSIDDYVPLTQKDAASGVASLDADKNVYVPGSSIIIEGSSDNANETTLTVTNPTADRTITFPDETGTVQLRVADVSDTEIGYLNGVTSAIQTQLDDKSTASKTETLTNKTLTSPVITGAVFNDGSIVFEGATANDFETTLTITDPTADRTITFPDDTGTVALAANVAALSGATFTGAVSGTDLTLSGNLTVNGTTTNLNSTSLVVEDKNIVLGDTTTPTDTTADGGGITLKGATDKTFNWVDSTDAWTSSEHINLASGKTLKYNGTDLVAAQSGNSGKYLTTDGTSTSWGTVSGYSAPTLGSTSIASGATVATIEGLTDVVVNGIGSVKDELTLLLMGAL
jgi:hypothetical protein